MEGEEVTGDLLVGCGTCVLGANRTSLPACDTDVHLRNFRRRAQLPRREGQLMSRFDDDDDLRDPVTLDRWEDNDA
ncbi:hypothetical protein B2J88_07950 [Rhodococcus sp. SRB_17]|nr:hypothetical protein [Rhodococcus sp. SRB_17]